MSLDRRHVPLLGHRDLTRHLTIVRCCDMFNKRLGVDPHANGAQSVGCSGCPDIFELEDGDFAIIGADITDSANLLPPSAGCGADERIVRIPRKTLVLAKQDIPDRF